MGLCFQKITPIWRSKVFVISELWILFSEIFAVFIWDGWTTDVAHLWERSCVNESKPWCMTPKEISRLLVCFFAPETIKLRNWESLQGMYHEAVIHSEAVQIERRASKGCNCCSWRPDVHTTHISGDFHFGINIVQSKGLNAHVQLKWVR